MNYTLLSILQVPGGAVGIGNILIFVAMFLVFYFFIIRPQTRKAKLQEEFWSNLQKGDKVVTSGGIFGKIVEIKDGAVVLEVDKNTKFKVLLSAISHESSSGAALASPAK